MLKIKLFFAMMNFEKKYLIYIGQQIGIKEKTEGKKIDWEDLQYCNKYLAIGVMSRHILSEGESCYGNF